MSQLLVEVQALLNEFMRSEWRDLYVRTEHCSLFIAKPAGGPNPMRTAVERRARETTMLRSPQLGTVVSMLEAGSPVDVGTIVGQIQVLDELIPIKSEQRGVIDAVLIERGALAEYETPLLRLISN